MEWNPEDYAKNSSAQLVWARELIARLALRGDETLMDVGCGDGKVTAEFALSVPRGSVLGIDSSPGFITYSREHYPPEDYPNLRFELMDARHIAAGQEYDLVFSNAALHWVDDQPAVLAGCARALKPGGRLVVSCGGTGNAADIIRVLDELVRQPRWQAYFAGFQTPYFFQDPVDYRAWLPEAGFSAARVELVEKDMVHPGRDGLAGWIRTTWMPWTARLPADLREEFIGEVVDAYLRLRPLDEQGKSHVRMVRLEVEARKGNPGGPNA